MMNSLHRFELELDSDSFSAVVNWRSSNCPHVNLDDVVVRPAALPGQLAAGNMPAGSCQQEGLGVFVILRTRTQRKILPFCIALFVPSSASCASTSLVLVNRLAPELCSTSFLFTKTILDGFLSSHATSRSLSIVIFLATRLQYNSTPRVTASGRIWNSGCHRSECTRAARGSPS